MDYWKKSVTWNELSALINFSPPCNKTIIHWETDKSNFLLIFERDIASELPLVIVSFLSGEQRFHLRFIQYIVRKND